MSKGAKSVSLYKSYIKFMSKKKLSRKSKVKDLKLVNLFMLT